METLGVVAIMVIVMCVASLSVGSLQKNMQMNQLDTTAQQIYDSAQSRLTSLQSAGKLGEVQASFDSGQFVGSVPLDYSGATPWADFQVHYTTKGQATCDTYLITNDAASITKNTLNGFYLLEVSALSGEVYGVFYAETPFTYADIQALGNRSRDSRSSASIGYYGGGELNVAGIANHVPLDDLSVDYVNGEELYLKISNGSTGFPSSIQSDLQLTLHVQGSKADGTIGSFEKTLTSGTDFVIGAGDTELDLILDSMRDGMHFADLVGSSIVPGSDITVYVSATSGNQYFRTRALTMNSLYGERDAASKTVQISNLRHLNNLHDSLTGNKVDGANDITTVNLTADISGDAATWNPANMSPQSRDGSGNAVNPITTFVPIANKVLSSGSTFAGNNHKISNLNIGGTTDTGLFSKVDFTVKDVMLADVAVTGTDNVGALVGTLLQNGKVSNCGVYVEKTASDGSYLTDTYKVAATGSNVGGLVGKVSSLSSGIESSFAAVNVSGTRYVGGFIGAVEANAGTVTASYSSGNVTANEYGAGFISSALSKIDNCYTTSNVACDRFAAGFTSVYGAEIKDSISYGRVTKVDGTVDTASANDSQAFAASRLTGGSYVNCAYLQMTGYNDSFDPAKYGDQSAQPTAKLYTDLQVPDADKLAVDKCHPYDSALAGTQFPFAHLSSNDRMFGNWPKPVATITWEVFDYASNQFVVAETQEVEFGVTPVFSGENPTYNNVSKQFIFTSTGWSPAVGPATGDVTYVAQYQDNVGLSYAQMSSLLIDPDQNDTWKSYITSRVNSSGQAKANITMDSEATKALGYGGYGESTKRWIADEYNLSADSYSFRVHIASGTYVTGTEIGKKGSVWTNNYLVYMGPKIDLSMIGQRVDVVCCDMGRKTSGEQYNCKGTAEVIYSPAHDFAIFGNFILDGGWYA